MKEYDRTDAALYDYYATGIEGDVQFYVEEAQKSGSPVLEIGCGTGRILIPVAESGINIVGLDRAPAMLSIAKQKVSKFNVETKGRIKLVEGDMRNFSLDQRFKLVMIPYRAFLHLLTPEDQRQALCCIREHLMDSGLLIFNIFDPRLETIAAHINPLGAAMKSSQEFIHPDTGHKVIVWDSRKYDPGRQMLEQYFIFEELDDEGRVISKTYSPITLYPPLGGLGGLRYVYRYEMQYLLELCGYEIEALFGSLTNARSGLMVWRLSTRAFPTWW